MQTATFELWILTRTLASIEKILSLNKETTDLSNATLDTSAKGLIPQSTSILNENGEPIWKVLVFDNMGRDIISSVLRVNDLRARGVTIHLSVNQSGKCPDGHLGVFRLRYDGADLVPETSIHHGTQYPMYLFSISLNQPR